MESTMYAKREEERTTDNPASPRPTPHYQGQIEQIGQLLVGANRRIDQLTDQLRPIINLGPVPTNGEGEKRGPGDKQPTELAENLDGLLETARQVEGLLTALQNRIHL